MFTEEFSSQVLICPNILMQYFQLKLINCVSVNIKDSNPIIGLWPIHLENKIVHPVLNLRGRPTSRDLFSNTEVVR